MKNDGIKFSVHKGKHTVIAIDSTGLRPVNDGEYRSFRYDNRKEWIKLHAVIDVKTKEILNVKVTKGNVNDCLEFSDVINPVSEISSEILADKGYDSTKIFEYCDRNNIICRIPVKLNATNRSKRSAPRRNAIEEQLKIICKPGYASRGLHCVPKEDREKNQEQWKIDVKYGRRSLIESSFSRYKRILGENVFSRKTGNIEKEITAKVNVLNQFTVAN